MSEIWKHSTKALEIMITVRVPWVWVVTVVVAYVAVVVVGGNMLLGGSIHVFYGPTSHSLTHSHFNRADEQDSAVPDGKPSDASFSRFFDLAPSGQFGTVTYVGRALVLSEHVATKDMEGCRVS